MELTGAAMPSDLQAHANIRGGDGYLPNSPLNVGDNVQTSLVQDPESQELRQSSCWPKSQQLTPGELLPQDSSSTWAQAHPVGVGSLQDRNFLQAGHHVGINTVGQTLRNANLQLRSEPPNPQVKISPWLQSSIAPDTNRRYFEVGSC